MTARTPAPIKWVAGVALLAAWFSWDFGCTCVRTFILGHSVRRQLEEIQPEDEL